MNDKYILKGHEVVESNLTEWSEWFSANDRKVARDTVNESDISTVFLGLDHSFGEGPPLLFETLVFSGKLDGEMDRYSTWDEAIAGHAAMIERVRKET